ncbi:MAG: sulfite oxidase [Chloroflexi bacterium]|nr:sulfite oxidase [Chloroflexota bacterium]MDA1227126.1 sulfite oxidase [Chloroflexota bacterium]
MTQEELKALIRTVGDGTGLSNDELIYPEELALAFRNRGLPLEGIRYPITPTGMHYLLTHFDIPDVDVTTWKLKLHGLVSNQISLSLENLRNLPSVSQPVTMECAGNGRARLTPRPISQPWLLEAIGTAEWGGTPLRGVLEQAGVSATATEILFTGRDEGLQGGEVQLYQRSLTVEEAMRDEVLLAYEMNGAPLEPQHGYPLRLIVPSWYGMTSVKWLDSIEAIPEHFDGYQMDQTYRYTVSRDKPGEPVTTMRVRSLMVPPGIPEFLTRTRLAYAGEITVTGRAWAGRQRVTKVEFSDDDGMNWIEADLGEQVGQYAWTGWSYQWHATLGRHFLRVRATDSEGNTQPSDQPWTLQGMGNNMTQRVEVIVR